MATLDDVARMASALPEVTEGESRGWRTWSVAGKAFAWGWSACAPARLERRVES